MILMWSYNYTDPDILEHYGILGMKWGVRRFQDKKGRLTSAGKRDIAKNLLTDLLVTHPRLLKKSEIVS